MKMIYTSYFGQIKNLPDNYEPICIARWKPKWYNGKVLLSLAPSDRLLRWWKSSKQDEAAQEKYKAAYMSMLKTYKEAALERIIKNIAASKVPVLVCFEKDGFCHRHLIAEWFNSHGIECEEWKKPVVNTNTFPVAAMTTAAATYKTNERVHYENVLYRCV